MGSDGGGDVDDRSAALAQHVGKRGTATKVGAVQVDGEHPFPRVLCRVEHGAVEEDARAVEEDIQMPVLAQRSFHNLGHLPRVGYVDLDELGLAALVLNLLHRFPAAESAAIG